MYYDQYFFNELKTLIYIFNQGLFYRFKAKIQRLIYRFA